MHRGTLQLALVAAMSLTTASAASQSRVDMIEHLFGASNINAVAGNGGLTVGISALGDLAVLSWPSPSYTDHVLHIASNALDVRESAQMMGHAAMGAAVGIAWQGGGETGFSWLRDEPWQVAQRYGDVDTPLIETVFSHAALGLEVVVADFVTPHDDIWVRHVSVQAEPTSVVAQVDVVHYANLAPTLSRLPQLPVADWALDAYNDFAAVYDSDSETIVHFRPAGHGDLTQLTDLLLLPDVHFGALGDTLAAGQVSETAARERFASLDLDYGPGVYLALGASAPLSGHQIGYDETPVCAVVDSLVDNTLALSEVFEGYELPLDPQLLGFLRCEREIADIITGRGWQHSAMDAFSDASDGALSGSPAAAGRVNEAISVTLPLEAGTTREVSFFLAAAATASDATSLLDRARGVPAAEHRQQTVDHWRQLLSRAHLPDTDNARVLDVCRRALVNVFVGTDRDSGAIVASVSRQASYAVDWPRDGAFFNAALDIAGYPELVEKHNRFYLDVVRRQPAAPEPLINPPPPPDPDDPTVDTYPAWSWEMNYYADGMTGGNIRFEIDNAGLVLWSFADHGRYIADDGARRAWYEEVWPVLEPAADLLARWRDPATGLQAVANEDDNVHYTRTLHGAVTTWLALDSAVAVALALGHESQASRWGARADELKQVITTRLIDPATNLFVEELDAEANPGNAPGGASSWAIWPAGLLSRDDPRVAAQLQENLRLATHILDPANGGGSYVTKMLIPAALLLSDPDDRRSVESALAAMVELAATPDTGVFGEAFVSVDRDGDGAFDGFSARVSNPHLWAGVLVYLTAMALHAPERFDHPIGAPDAPGDSGGGCRQAPLGGGAWCLVWVWALLPWLAARRRCW